MNFKNYNKTMTKMIRYDIIHIVKKKGRIMDFIENIISKDKIKKDELMSKHTSFKTGGTAEYFITAQTIEDIRNVVDYSSKNNIPLYIIGNGSNILVSDKGVKGIVLKIDLQKIEIEENEEDIIVTVGAGTKIMTLAQNLLKEKVTGFEELSGIPGTIGGAIKMNAGAYGKEIKDIIISTICMNKNGEIVKLSNEEQGFSYRYSNFFENDLIILETKLLLHKGEEKTIKEKMDEYLMQRKQKQPTEYPSAGSTFKRGDGFITAKLIDEIGLKGYTIGGAEISEKHAGFIINKGYATSQDIYDLIQYTKQKVYEKFKVNIEEEVQLIGDFTKE